MVDTNECPCCLEEFKPIKIRGNRIMRFLQKLKEIGIREIRDHRRFVKKYNEDKDKNKSPVDEQKQLIDEILEGNPANFKGEMYMMYFGKWS